MGTSFGRGGATTYQQDLANSDCIVIMGSNMAECHPVGFQWVVEAKERGARVVHVDPRFTRTSALADLHVPLRPGSDIAFLGGLINYVLTHEADFREYVLPYTNASHVVSEDAELPTDLDGLFSGYDPETRTYDDTSWQYEGSQGLQHVAAAGDRDRDLPADHEEEGGEAFEGGSIEDIHHVERDETLTHPRCVYQLLKRHYAAYTPEKVAEACGIDVEAFRTVAEWLVANSGREATSAFVYSVGWTQHTVGAQYIRAASVLQLLLGNVGRPGGGILALRGHASIQGSTDIPTLFDLLPGYLPMPHAEQHPDLDTYEQRITAHKGFWANARAFAVSLLKAWFGEHATAENDYLFNLLPRLTGDHNAYQTALDMIDGTVRGYLLFGQNPAVGSANSGLHREALRHLDWLVVRDLTMIESAEAWRSAPEVTEGRVRPEDVGTEVFFLPSAAHVEKDGTFTNTQRLLQWHERAVWPAEDQRSDLWFCYHLMRRIRSKLSADPEAAEEPRNASIFSMTWDYPTEGAIAEPDADAVLREINGRHADGTLLSGYPELTDDGSTACGCWIYSGCYADGVNQTARRTPRTEMGPVAAEWAWAWPDNRRVLYNRASADPEGNPWSERKALVWWDPEAAAWTGDDRPDFVPGRPPDYVPDEDALGPDAIAGTDPFVMQADGKGWLWAPSGLADGPLPTHYEPREAPTANPIEGQQSNPALREYHHRLNPYHGPIDGPDDPYPYVATTYRVAEHHTAGGMSRFSARLSELAPEMFVEVHPDLAVDRDLEHGGWATVSSARGVIEARVLVTERIAPLNMAGRIVHQIGLPYHWGHAGRSTGDAANDLFPIVLDPNVYIQEVKAGTCDIRPGRRRRGPGAAFEGGSA
ncbi:formate dehydrogenase [Egibacter rhizosphaerae]|uniref:Formate dehydrogenase n=1 Tax=Egibacter rhizosphaerae TaxID=1670831 RepID=A0A411YB39_9ACTN|nr:formate dehydrogenase [Egibacter rhizosphaerae]